MNDEIVEEVRWIRKSLYEEDKKLSPEQRRERANVASDWIQQQIAEHRTQCGMEKNSPSLLTTNPKSLTTAQETPT